MASARSMPPTPFFWLVKMMWIRLTVVRQQLYFELKNAAGWTNH
jgi:hypothetical protein